MFTKHMIKIYYCMIAILVVCVGYGLMIITAILRRIFTGPPVEVFPIEVLLLLAFAGVFACGSLAYIIYIKEIRPTIEDFLTHSASDPSTPVTPERKMHESDMFRKGKKFKSQGPD